MFPSCRIESNDRELTRRGGMGTQCDAYNEAGLLISTLERGKANSFSNRSTYIERDGRSDVPSTAAVVSIRRWPLISKYKASTKTQSSKVEIINSFFKLTTENDDDGIIRKWLIDSYTSSEKGKSDQIIAFRDGVSESQFNQVMNIELDRTIEACKFINE
ncbi:hypothetical protein M5K25_027369 [Dendrobium thyrsiflorum]|uniref:Piwi domain-containing protein n=1 Tax=Dendrobium thyrsiflorum TaxID=117978 RepID=A0ABD0TZP4_DENTH